MYPAQRGYISPGMCYDPASWLVSTHATRCYHECHAHGYSVVHRDTAWLITTPGTESDDPMRYVQLSKRQLHIDGHAITANRR